MAGNVLSTFVTNITKVYFRCLWNILHFLKHCFLSVLGYLPHRILHDLNVPTAQMSCCFFSTTQLCCLIWSWKFRIIFPFSPSLMIIILLDQLICNVRIDQRAKESFFIEKFTQTLLFSWLASTAYHSLLYFNLPKLFHSVKLLHSLGPAHCFICFFHLSHLCSFRSRANINVKSRHHIHSLYKYQLIFSPATQMILRCSIIAIGLLSIVECANVDRSRRQIDETNDLLDLINQMGDKDDFTEPICTDWMLQVAMEDVSL